LLPTPEGRPYGKRFVRSLVREVHPARDGIALAILVGILRREVREARSRVGKPPVIVHTHSSKAGILGRAAARLAGVPVVIHTVHGFGFHARQRPGVRRFFIALERLAARWTTHIAAVAQADLERSGARPLCSRARQPHSRGDRDARHGDGIDRSRLSALRFGQHGRWSAWWPVSNRRKTVDFVGQRAVARKFRMRSHRRRGLRPAVGRIPAVRLGSPPARVGRDVEAIIPCLDVLVLTSLWEGLPRVFPQAMAAGRPIVAYRVDSAPEAVTEGVTGYLVDPGDYRGAAARIAGLLADPALARRMGAAGREQVGTSTRTDGARAGAPTPPARNC
jgi:hypothetical protein